MQRASRKEIFGWAMFDFANQAYTLLIITVVFGDLFTRVIVGDADQGYRLGNLLWSVALAISYLAVVIAGPVCGAIMDFSAARKRFLFASYLMTVVTTALLYFVAPGYIWLGMLLIILSNFAYAIGESFIASFLPDLGPPESLGWISGFGWALGYVGGLVSTAFALLFLGEVSLENFDNVRWVGPFAAGFFLVTAIPTFLWLQERGRRRRLARGASYLWLGLRRVQATLATVGSHRDLAWLLVSVFFAMAGIYIIISFTFIYGAQVVGWDEQTRVIMFVVVQLTAAAGALGFGYLQDHIGAKLTYGISLTLWLLAVLLIFGTPQIAHWLTAVTGSSVEPQQVFLVVGSVAGLCLGSVQSAGRALVGQFAPRLKAAEFFGFWGLSSKLAAIVGLLGIGVLQAWVGLQAAILLCLLLFALALVAILPINEARGRAAALARPRPA
ncbi:MFS transporter [Thioalkalivibrio sulfidiphilus]|uniref:Major facilitator superfamily MFS_1 n=1 Tax=Thioalkalivibrio sulfidiphilus (strain HL-EbGR7) TaxID=396588 RepID=B8GUN5_THISH|nr:MFS transporter [Thioalkalivibrio sulfidiphilus]ACL71396.1 major facilitator superfamily MFS_1 [Thioalkalivibrio sulfidiphilus HL-EbGr7]